MDADSSLCVLDSVFRPHIMHVTAHQPLWFCLTTFGLCTFACASLRVYTLANMKQARKASSRSSCSRKRLRARAHSKSHLLPARYHSLEMISSSSDSCTSEDDIQLNEMQRAARKDAKQKRRKARNQRRYYRRWAAIYHTTISLLTLLNQKYRWSTGQGSRKDV